MKKITLLIFANLISLFSLAQLIDTSESEHEIHWQKGMGLIMNFNQASFTNWAAGGENSVAASGVIRLFANYKKSKSSWDNSLDMAYGMFQQGTSSLRKNDDKIDLTSTYGRYVFSRHWWYSALISFKSQFAPGYDYPNDTVMVSNFLAPGYLLGAVGINYKSSDNNSSLFLSPLTLKSIIVNDQRLADKGAYGLLPAKYDTVNTNEYILLQHADKYRNQFGAYLKIMIRKEIFKNVNFNTRLELFSNYLLHPENIVVNWETNIDMKVNKYLTASILTNMIYDDNIPVPITVMENGVEKRTTGPRLQFKEVFSIGLTFSF